MAESEQETGAQSNPAAPGCAIVIGASGGIGQALLEQLQAQDGFAAIFSFSRSGPTALDLLDEASIARAAGVIAASGLPPRLIIDATGVLEGDGCLAEKSLRQLDAASMAKSFAVNTIGPALLLKHFHSLLPREGKSIFATLSARVGSIGDNKLGGWFSYRASKAALNQIVRTAAVELRRTRPQAICAALHPGTVATRLSTKYASAAHDVQTPAVAAARLLDVIHRLTPADSGGFFDHRGEAIEW
jgi:NAD(P)-dependent dehydrogenase (short-subunit alcohol dehydrogenase family)